jgi:Arc/MetJ-type ribon-helix-helix transcriptional regulator
MNISLSPETQKLLEERLTDGGFRNVDDLVRAALESLGRRDEGLLDDETLAAIDESEAQIARGEYHDWKEVSAELRRDYLGE